MQSQNDQDAAALDLGGNTYYLKTGIHLIGNHRAKFSIEDESVDHKHAIINIMDSQHQIIDLESERGTYIDNEKINESYLITNKVSIIQFGNFIAKYTILNQSDSGFLENKCTTPDKDNFDVVASSPQQSRRAKIRYMRNRGLSLTTSSTPNQRLISSISEEIKQNKLEFVKVSNDNSRVTSLSDDLDGDSFYVPETQHIDETKLHEKKKNIFDTEVDETVKQFLNDRSLEDEYYIPETQEIFIVPKKNKSNEVVNISTQEFNGFDKSNITLNDNFSQNLCPYLETVNKIISTDEHMENITSNRKEKENADETESLAKLEWTETEYDNRSDATTPDINIEELLKISKSNDKVLPNHSTKINNEIEKTFEKINNEINKLTNDLEDEEEIACTQIFAPPRKKTQNSRMSMDNTNDLECTQTFFFPPTKKTHNSKISMDNLNDLECTQTFLFPPTKKTQNSKMSKENSNDVECTQTFFSPPTKKTQNSKMSMDNSNDLECTQTFFSPPTKKTQNSKMSIDNSNDLECTQAFVHPNSKITKRNKNVEDDIKEPPHKKKASSTTNFMEKKSISPSSNSPKKFKTPYKTPIAAPVTLEDADFMMDVCTPAIEMIKLAPKEYGYMKFIEKIKKPINKIFGEETDDEDDDIMEPGENTNSREELEKRISIDLRDKNPSKKNSPHKTESEETPKFDFLQPIIPVEEIKLLDNSKFFLKNRKKFIIEESQTTDSIFMDYEELENQTKLKEKLKTVPEKRAKKTSNIKKKKEPNKDRKISQEKRTSEVLVNELNIMQKNLKRPFSDATVTTNSSSRSLRRNKKTSTYPKLNGGSESNSHQCIVNSESDSTRSDGSIKSNWPSRSSRRNKTTLMFTKVNEDKYIETVKNIGYTIVNDPEDASIIITNNYISRTWKFLIGLAKGIPIISIDWLEAIQEKNFSYVHYDNYYVKDKKAEKKFNFILRETLNMATNSTQPIFSGYNFIITQNTSPPKLEMEKIIQCAGGTVLNQTKVCSKLVYAVSDKKDSNLWSTLRSNFTNLIIIKAEGVLLSIMQHRNRLDDHKFK